MPVAVEGRERDVLRLGAGADIGVEHLAAEIGPEEGIVLRIEPQARDAGGRAITGGRLDQTPRRAVADLRLAAAAPAGEIDDREHAGGISTCSSDRSPASRRVTDQENAVALRLGAGAEEGGRGLDILRRGQPGTVVVRIAARAILLEPGTAGLPVAAPQRQRDHVPALEQPARRQGKSRDFHIRTLCGARGRAVADDRQRKRPAARRPKHARAQRGAGRGRYPDDLLDRSWGARDRGRRCSRWSCREQQQNGEDRNSPATRFSLTNARHADGLPACRDRGKRGRAFGSAH